MTLAARLLARCAPLALIAAAACSDKLPTDTDDGNNGGGNVTELSTTAATLGSVGLGSVADRFSAEVWTRGTIAYTTTWGSRGAGRGNAVKIWDVSSATPRLVDSVIVENASTLGDVQTSDDGTLLIVAIESNPNGGLAIYRLDNPTKPQLLVRTTGGDLQYGVHTAEVARVGGKLYAFCAMDPANGVPAKLVIMDLTNPAAPVQVSQLTIGAPFIHDVFVRDGLLFTAEWHDGSGIWDIGAQGGSVNAPRRLSRTTSVGGSVHNLWWYHDPSDNTKRFLFVGEEGPGSIGSGASGDIHVLDVSNLASPREVAAFNVPGAGVHNFWVDEPSGLLYAAFYNAGVRVLDVRGDLGTCTAAQKFADGRCNLGLMGREKARFSATQAGRQVYVWGVHQVGASLYASDMLNGLWKIQRSVR
ncbi:MAG: hypothetical protein V4617_06770 [Gemmatimonadota bacterium]